MHCHLRPPIPTVILGFSKPGYKISAKSDNLWTSYSDLTIFNLGAVSHLGFDQKWILTMTPQLCRP